MGELTFREVAGRERISVSTAHGRHQKGMAALREARESADRLRDALGADARARVVEQPRG